MGAVLLIHLDRVVRERIEDALRTRGLTVFASVDVEAALELAEKAKISAVLVDPRILVKEQYDVSARFASRAGTAVRIIALTHVAGAMEAQAFQRHGASLLIAPLESLDLLALYLGTDTPMPGEEGRRDEHLPAEKGAAGPSVQMSSDFDLPDDGSVPVATEGETETALAAAAPPAPAPAFDEVTNVQRAPADPAAPAEEPITPEMEAALVRARAEVRRIREEHEAQRRSGAPPVAPPSMTPSALLRDLESAQPWTTPAVRSDVKEELAAIAAPKLPGGGVPRVLVIEDDLGCRDFFQDALAARGYHVHSCASVPAAIRFIQRGNKLDLIVSDINMPIFDGFELKWMLDHEARLASIGAIPFLAVSAEDTAEKYSLALRLGAVALVPKPVKNLRAFCKLVRQTLEQAWSEARGGAAPR